MPEEKIKPAEPSLPTEQQAQIQQQAQQLQQLQQQQQQMWAQSHQAGAAPATPDANQRQQVSDAFFERPFEATQAVAAREANRAAQAMGQALQAKNHPRDVEIARDKVRDSDKEVFERYREEVEAEMGSSYAPDAHTDPRVWKVALTTVKDRHFDEIVQEKMKTKIKARGGPESPSVAEAPARGAGADAPLEGDEKTVARDIFRMSDKEYRSGQEHLDAQKRGVPGSGDPLKSPWGRHVKSRLIGKENRREILGPGPILTLDSELQGRRSRQLRENADG